MKILEDIKGFYDEVFGNSDGKFDIKDLPNGAPAIVAIIADLVMLVAEIRVYEVGYKLTGVFWLAIGFVAISSIPFYLGQLAWLYNKANKAQRVTAIILIFMGLIVSAYYGLADFLMGQSVTVGNVQTDAIDVSTLYMLAVVGTGTLIVLALFYMLVDDNIAMTIQHNRMLGRAKTAQKRNQLKRVMLAELKATRLAEKDLQNEFPEDYAELQKHLSGKKQPKEPANTSQQKPPTPQWTPRPEPILGYEPKPLADEPLPTVPTEPPTPDF